MAHANIDERRKAVHSYMNDGAVIEGSLLTCLALEFDCSIGAINADVIALMERGGGPIYPSARLKQDILERDQHLCQYCGRMARIVDHVVPLSLGGPSVSYNLVASCQRCNMIKKGRSGFPDNLFEITKDFPDWRDEVYKHLEKKPRKGAGRKPLDMVRLTVYVTRDQRRHVKFLDLNKSLSENMRSILDDSF